MATTTAAMTRNVTRSAIIGLLIGVGFGLWWFLGGASALGAPWQTPLDIVGVALTAAIVVAAFALMRSIRSLPSGASGSPFTRPIYLLSVLFELVGIPVALRLLTAAGHPEYAVVVIAVIVGLHLFGVALAFRQPALLIIGAAMCLISLLTVLILPVTATLGPAPGHAVAVWDAAIGLGVGATFLLGCGTGVLYFYREMRGAQS